MACGKCKSKNLRSLHAELTVTFGALKSLNHSPVYVCQDIWVCLDCGHTEFVMPAKELDQIKEGMSESQSHESSRGSTAAE